MRVIRLVADVNGAACATRCSRSESPSIFVSKKIEIKRFAFYRVCDIAAECNIFITFGCRQCSHIMTVACHENLVASLKIDMWRVNFSFSATTNIECDSYFIATCRCNWFSNFLFASGHANKHQGCKQ